MTDIIPDYFKRRATVRLFSDKAVSASTIDSIIEAAAHAPNTGNMQLYSVVVTTEPEQRSALAPLHFNQPAATGAPVLLTVCADIHRFGRWCENRDAVSGLDNFGGYLAAITDAAIFAQQIVTIAEMTGLGCCYLGTATYNVDGFVKALGLPDGVLPLAGIAMGYPAQAESPASDRLPLDAIRHKEQYHACSDSDIDRFYAEKEGLDESRMFVDENGKSTLAQVYADIRYPEALNKAVGEQVMARISKK